MRHRWQGVFPAVTTQFKSDLCLDLDATARHLERLMGSGIAGVVMLGSLGENNALEPAEKLEVVRMARQVCGGKIQVLAGVSELSTAQACRRLGEYEQAGLDGAMVLPAMAYPADRAEAIAHFRALAQAADLPLMLYNNPIAYPVDLRPEILAELADEPKFVAIKESSGDTRRITDIFNTVGDRYAVFSGVDDLAFECTALGAVGWVAGVGLAFPEANQTLWELMTRGRWDEARRLYRWYTPLLHLDVGPKFVQKIKLALQEVGLGSERVRPPRYPLTGSEREGVIATVRHALDHPVLP